MSLTTKVLFPLAVLLISTLPGQAQISYGFKTGLNFSRFDAPSEQSANGTALETWRNVTGFHIGAAFGLPITDHFGIRAEALYSKKGVKYTYEGPSYRFFTPASGSPILTTGDARYLLSITQSYIDIPIFGYARFGDFEFQAGPYVALNIQSAAEGSLRYTANSTLSGTRIGEYEFNLDHNYRKDDPGEGDNTQTVKLTVDGKAIEMPKTLGAYYDFTEDRGNLYNSLDYGLMGGASYYLSSALYLGVRLQYGLADLSRTEADISRSKLGDGNALIFNNDKDRNFTIQASVGFSF